jgi:hypothetical protein
MLVKPIWLRVADISRHANAVSLKSVQFIGAQIEITVRRFANFNSELGPCQLVRRHKNVWCNPEVGELDLSARNDVLLDWDLSKAKELVIWQRVGGCADAVTAYYQAALVAPLHA